MRRGLLIAAMRGGPAILAGLSAAFVLAPAACEDISHADISDEINILVRRDDALVPPATDRLAVYQRKAIPQIETAIHTAAPSTLDRKSTRLNSSH